MKQTLLFIHGFRGNHLGLEEIAKNFSSKKDYDILIPDIPPAGKNDLPEYSARHYARFIANYIKKNKLKKPILIGHSMGTIVAAAVAERYPDLINKKIIFLSPISTKPNNFLAILTPLTAILPNKIIGFISSKYTHVKASGKPIREILQTTYLCGADYVSKKAVYL